MQHKPKSEYLELYACECVCVCVFVCACVTIIARCGAVGRSGAVDVLIQEWWKATTTKTRFQV